MDDDELTTLLGKNLDLKDLTGSINQESKEELAKIDPEQLETKLLDEHNDILNNAKNAVADVLLQLQTTPNDGELIEGAAKLLNSYSGLLNGLHKIYAIKEKFRQQVVLQSNKILADDKINQDNNNTKILLSREDILKKIDKNNIIEVEEKK